jgi:hypothetical protein
MCYVHYVLTFVTLLRQPVYGFNIKAKQDITMIHITLLHNYITCYFIAHPVVNRA